MLRTPFSCLDVSCYMAAWKQLKYTENLSEIRYPITGLKPDRAQTFRPKSSLKEVAAKLLPDIVDAAVSSRAHKDHVLVSDK